MALASPILLTIMSFDSLPESIPSHFDITGNPDAYSSKLVLWVLPAVSLVAFVGLTMMERNPHVYNYPVTITEGNARAQYANAVLTTKLLKTVILGQLASLMFFQRQVALGVIDSIPGWWVPISVVCVLGPVIWFALRSIQLR